MYILPGCLRSNIKGHFLLGVFVILMFYEFCEHLCVMLDQRLTSVSRGHDLDVLARCSNVYVLVLGNLLIQRERVLGPNKALQINWAIPNTESSKSSTKMRSCSTL